MCCEFKPYLTIKTGQDNNPESARNSMLHLVNINRNSFMRAVQGVADVTRTSFSAHHYSLCGKKYATEALVLT
jgi:hypothetical protein